jgi:regulatory protein
MLVERFAASGYVDDAGYALSKSRSLLSRGYGKQRVEQSLRVAGVGDDDGAEARAHADQEAVTAALRYARRKRIGPYAAAQADMAARQKALAAMVRAGHNFTLSRAVIDLPAGEEPDEDVLKDAAGRSTD